MGFLATVSDWFKRETADVKQATQRLEDRIDADLTRRERELADAPLARMESIRSDTQAEDLLTEIQAKIDGRQAKALADDELSTPPPEMPTP